MPFGSYPVLRVLTFVAAVALFVAGCVLGYIAGVALRRGEGVFLPAGYVAVIFFVGAAFAWRAAIHS